MEIKETKHSCYGDCAGCAFDTGDHCGLRGFISQDRYPRAKDTCSARSEKAPEGYELQSDGYFSWVEPAPAPLTLKEKVRSKFLIQVNKPRWKNKEWSFNVIPYISITKISNLVIAVHIGWLFWGITISNDF